MMHTLLIVWLVLVMIAQGIGCGFLVFDKIPWWKRVYYGSFVVANLYVAFQLSLWLLAR